MSEWLFGYQDYDPDQEGLREALCTVGNGYLATRGALPESGADGTHRPGTYLAGVYNRLTDDIGDRQVTNESLVNVPNWLPVAFRVSDGDWFDVDGCEVLDHCLELDLHRGVLMRRSRLRDARGRIIGITQRRFVSMRDAHLAAIETTLVAENWSGTLEVRSALDGTVRNDGVPRYQGLDGQHLAPIGTSQVNDETVALLVETTTSFVRIAEAARTRVWCNGTAVDQVPAVEERPGWIGQTFAIDVAEGDQVRVEKVVAVFSSRDHGTGEPLQEASDWAAEMAGDVEELLARHVVSWRHIWDRVRIDLGTDGELARVLHLHLFHLVQTVSNNSVPLDVGVPARGLHGEAYRGHIFWDELFILPFLSLRMPQLARALLLYRYRRLDQARRAARDAGLRGAMYPWQSASSGREETQTMHLNPRSGRWLPDASHLQRHVNAAIVFNIWQYFQATNDIEFLRFFGAEMILEVARFWSSIATYDHALARYEITGVMGPDEYHEGYVDHEEPGLDNNSYTNLMAVWCLRRAAEVLETLPPVSVRELRERLSIDEAELDLWDDISHKMRVCFHEGVISQFEGFGDLAELDWSGYTERYGDISRLDRILEAEGDSADRYKLTKQADAMMVFYVLSPNEVADLLGGLGYEWDDGLVARNNAYYEPRTVHGSTLSRVVHAWINARLDPERSWSLFTSSLRGDVDDTQGGTTAEGIHLGAMAGTVDLLQRCYTGLELRHDVLRFDPVIPAALGSLAFAIRYRGHVVHLEFTTEVARIRVDIDEGEAITVDVAGAVSQVRPGELLEVVLDRTRPGTRFRRRGVRRRR